MYVYGFARTRVYSSTSSARTYLVGKRSKIRDDVLNGKPRHLKRVRTREYRVGQLVRKHALPREIRYKDRRAPGASSVARSIARGKRREDSREPLTSLERSSFASRKISSFLCKLRPSRTFVLYFRLLSTLDHVDARRTFSSRTNLVVTNERISSAVRVGTSANPHIRTSGYRDPVPQYK